MSKKALNFILVGSILALQGCYDVVTLPREDYRSVKQYDDVSVISDSSGIVTKYVFSRGMCVMINDTLVGTGTRMTDLGEEEGVNVTIPVSRVNVVDVKKLNFPVSLAVAGLIVAVTVGAIFLIGAPGSSGGQGSQPPSPQ